MATKRIKDLTTTATQMDLISENYGVLDTSGITKKVPGYLLGGGSGGDGKTYTGIAPVNVDNINDTIEVDIMQGASSDNDGKSGTVPKPLSGEENKFLRADGTWAQINQLSDANEVTDMVTFFSTDRSINLCNIYNNDRYYSTTYSLPSSMTLSQVRSYYIDDIMYFFTEAKNNQIYATNGIYLTFNNEVPRVIYKYKSKYFVGTSGDINHAHNIYVSSNNKLSDLTSVYSATATTDLVGIYYIFECNNQLFAISVNDVDISYKILRYNESNNVFELFNNDIYSSQPSYLFYINGNYVIPQYDNDDKHNPFVLLNSDGTFSRYLNTPGGIQICRCKIDEHNFIDQNGNIVSITDDYVIQLHEIIYPNRPYVRTYQCIRDTVNNQIIFNASIIDDNTICNYFINESNYTISKIAYLPTSNNINTFRYLLYTKAYSYGVQSDWNENNVNSPAYINNKPDLDWKDISSYVTNKISGSTYRVMYNEAIRTVSIDFQVNNFYISSTNLYDILTIDDERYKPKFPNIACSGYAMLTTDNTDTEVFRSYIEDTGKMKVRFNNRNISVNLRLHVMYFVG